MEQGNPDYEQYVTDRAKSILWNHVRHIENGDRIRYNTTMAISIHQYQQLLKKRIGA